MKFEDFMKLKENWLKNVRFDWMIHGHITQHDAKQMAEESIRALGDDITLLKERPKRSFDILEVPSKTMLNYESINKDDNGNNAYLAMF